MIPLVFLNITLVVLSFFSADAWAGPACARRLSASANACITQCKDKWGWPGRVMGDDPWGPVLKPAPKSQDQSAMAYTACGLPYVQKTNPLRFLKLKLYLGVQGV